MGSRRCGSVRHVLSSGEERKERCITQSWLVRSSSGLVTWLALTHCHGASVLIPFKRTTFCFSSTNAAEINEDIDDGNRKRLQDIDKHLQSTCYRNECRKTTGPSNATS